MMTKEKYEVLLPIIVSDFVKYIVKHEKISEKEALKLIYQSKLYSLLEIEGTKVWYYSTPTLYQFLLEELETGKIDFPDV